MKQNHWILSLFLLTGIVFLVTFLRSYDVGDASTTRSALPKAKDPPKINFYSQHFPLPDQVMPIEEPGADGFQDFWFTNDNKDPVDLFLDATSCKCTEVQLFLPSKQWIERWMTLRRVGITLSEATQPLSALGMAFVVDQSPWVPFLGATKELGDGIKMKKGGLTGATIPAGQSGWVRLVWSGNRQESIGQAVRQASLFMLFRGGSPFELVAEIRLGAFFLPEPQRHLNLGELDPKQLPREIPILVWSGTRSHLDLVATHALVRGSESKDPFLIGKPVPASAAEIEKIEMFERCKVRCAYRIPVTIRDRADDNATLLDLGSFRRQILISLANEDWEPLRVTLQGSILSDVTLEGPGNVNLHEFYSDIGSKSETIRFFTTLENLKLEVDRERTPKFLSVSVPEKPEKFGKQFSWTVKISVDKNQAHGSFPRDDDPDYRDSAVYLKSVGANTRNIRIAVAGNAKER